MIDDDDYARCLKVLRALRLDPGGLQDEAAAQVVDEAAAPVLAKVARRRGATPYQIALAWLLSCSPVIIPIPSARESGRARDNLAAAAPPLDEQDLAALRVLALDWPERERKGRASLRTTPGRR